MINPTVELQAKMYVFDLGNCAKNFGLRMKRTGICVWHPVLKN